MSVGHILADHPQWQKVEVSQETQFSRRRCYATFNGGGRPRDNGRMSGKHPYEAVGLRPDGDSFTVEVLGCQTEEEDIG
jgi:hypothetical protein